MSGQDLNTTPTLEGFLEVAMKARLMGLHVGMPGVVESYDPARMLCAAQPSIKRIDNQGNEIALPVINNVPVGHLRANGAIVHMPLKKGDTVYLHFSERSLDAWKSTGSIATPIDTRLHDISDAVAYPGFYSFADKLTVPNPDALTVMNGSARLEVLNDGKFKLANSSQELFDLLDQTLQAILDARVNTIFGPQPVVNLATFSSIKSNLATLKG